MPGTTSHNTNNHSANINYSNYESQHGFGLRQFSMPYFCTLFASWFLCISG